LAAIGQLQQLTELQVYSDGMTQQQLMHLTSLSCLQKFELYNTAEITDEVIAKFWAAVRRQS
jgi:hypothetical protein